MFEKQNGIFWSAVAERSGDTALSDLRLPLFARLSKRCRRSLSLPLPPHSKAPPFRVTQFFKLCALAFALAAIAAPSLRAESGAASGTTCASATNTVTTYSLPISFAVSATSFKISMTSTVALDSLEKSLRSQAEEGDIAAQSTLGLFYFTVGKDNGKLPPDMHEAAKWLQKAADGGDAMAQYALGLMYSTGLGGLEKNMDEALRLYRAAANQGSLLAQKALGLFYITNAPQNFEEAAHWYKKAATEHGDAEAKAALFGLLTDNKIKASTPAEFLDWCHAAADAGNIMAQYMLFDAYDAGQFGPSLGLTTNEAEAKKWRDKIIAQNDAIIQLWLSTRAALNRAGHPADAVEAVKFLLDAAENKNRQVALDVSSLFQIFIPGPRPDQNDAINWLFAQAGKEHPWALFFLGTLYAQGVPSLPADKNKSQDFFNRAAGADMPSQLELARMFSQGIVGRRKWGQGGFSFPVPSVPSVSEPATTSSKP